MKTLCKKIIVLLAIIFLGSNDNGFTKSITKDDLSVALNYFVVNNQVQYLVVRVKYKIDGKFQPVAGIGLKLFLDKDSSGNFIGKIITNRRGEASIIIPASVKTAWAKSANHSFLASFDGNKAYEAAEATLTVAKAKILIEANENKTITASVLEWKDSTWVPINGVDLKIGVKRLGADLPVSETATFTTDSTGTASTEFARDSLPGDVNGNIILVARIDDNDTYGNLLIEKTVPWGAKFVYESTFSNRSLYATSDKAPIWLLSIVYAIVIAVWGILISLIISLFKIKRLGQEVLSSPK